VIGGVAVLVVAGLLLFLRGRIDKLALRAEAADPGPLE
jgi:hypothetical protein